VQWFEFDAPHGLIHGVNAWEVDDGASSPSSVVIYAPITDSFESKLTTKGTPTLMSRIELNITSGAASIVVIDKDNYVEFPRVHPNFISKPTRYGFALKYRNSIHGLVKYDFNENKVVGDISLSSELSAGEFVPIPKKSTKSDDDGELSDKVFLTTFIFNKLTNSSEWHVYDGETMSSEPVARYAIPARVPYGFHGEWISEEQLQLHFKNIAN